MTDKRQVSYNQEAVLCPYCKKRIRLNKDERIRVHISGKVGSPKCEGSNTLVKALPKTIGNKIDVFFDNPELVGEVRTRGNLFSDIEWQQ